MRMAGALDVLKLKATSSFVRFTSFGISCCVKAFVSLLAPGTGSGMKLYLTIVPASKKPPTSWKDKRKEQKFKITHICTQMQNMMVHPYVPRKYSKEEIYILLNFTKFLNDTEYFLSGNKVLSQN